ncbi:rnp domain containing protein [Grosmannia clavigera kw1407]|uniref:Rnp domain containing protein n=1 Tax=Grosmannia clavigera (strain kw1407 / UAMH 11150) TaxID=655863 RepID=F0XNH2_GROCL|nr:rnp domain containing protein [Grosmannia clavigera kw1407]EFX00829.1 rnp domain containing protein [Grosmannia clavigera kw1407]
MHFLADSGDTYRPRLLDYVSVNDLARLVVVDLAALVVLLAIVTPASGAPAGSAYSSGAPHRSHDDRQAARDQMMSNIRETSQQDRRVYVGNLSYDVKWHHLKDFMRQAGEVIFADVLLLPNGMSKDREAEPRFNQASGPRGGYSGAMGGAPAYGGPIGGPGFNPGMGGSRQIYVANLPFTIGWQDLKDLFRQAARTAGVARADINIGPDGRSRGSGIVVFESPDDARNAIQQFNGYDWQGRVLEVPPNPFTDHATSGNEPSEIIFVRNLPWSTSNEDLVELFGTIGKVEQAEIQYEPSGRSRGSGVVRFDNPETADTAISKFQGYQYGGRPLGLSFVKYLTPGVGGSSMESDHHNGLTQDQIM